MPRHRAWGAACQTSFVPTLTLGMDLLGSFDVLIIDYARHELQIRLRGSQLPGALTPF